MLNKLTQNPSSDGDPVKLIDQYPLYEVGGALGNLKVVCSRNSSTAFEQLMALFKATHNVNRLLKGDLVELSYSRDTAQRLLAQIENTIPNFRDQDGKYDTDNARRLEDWQLSELRSLIEMFEHQFSAELKKTAAYAVPRRGIFDTEKLVDHAERHFSQAVLAVIGEMSITEFKASGRCLAFGLFSASGYHAMRATESVLRKYYDLFKGKPDRELTMGQMASQLDELARSEKESKRPAPRTASALKDIASFDRNPVMHPTAVLDEEDALSLFSRAQGAIIDMARELIEHGDAHTQDDMLVEFAPRNGTTTNPKRKGKPTIVSGSSS